MIFRIFGRLVLAGFVFLVAASAGTAHEAQSGMVYEAWCCNGDANTGDCFEIPAKSVKARSDGYHVTLLPGDHPLVTEPHSWVVPYDEVRPATDGKFHACLYPTEADMRCFYAGSQGF